MLAPARGLRERRRATGGPGSLFHAVQIVVREAGEVSGRVLQAFAPVDAPARLIFGGRHPS